MRAFLVLNWSGIALIVSALLVAARIMTARCGQDRACARRMRRADAMLVWLFEGG